MVSVTESQVQTPVVALVGNPNAGKSSLFNSLTGGRQKIGNYPGVTVEKVTGHYSFGDELVQCVDIPGLYSLSPVSADEGVATTAIEAGADLLVYVVDAANLERNLFFFTQLCDTGLPMIVAVTMTDVLEREGKSLDVLKLEQHLKTRVVSVIAHKGQGIAELRQAISAALASPVAPRVDVGYPEAVTSGVKAIVLATGLNESDSREALLGEDPTELDVVNEERKRLLGETAKGKTIDAQARYAWAAMVARDTVTTHKEVGKSSTDKWDKLFTHRVFGLVVFLAVMYLVFQSIYTLAGPLMDLIDGGFEAIKGLVSPLLESTPVLQSLVVEGIITGIGAVVIFLPQICILFFFIAVLEGTGYLARAAFLMDRLLGWCGLNGRAFIPLLSSFACAVPGIMAARVMPDEKSRLATILVAPLMSCSARLPVYVLLIGAFIEPQFGPIWAGVALFAMHFVGLFVAIPVVFVLNRGVLKGKRLPFTLELPRYQMPRWKDVAFSVYSRGRMFLQTAGTIIFAMSIVIWALLYFPRSDAAVQRYAQEYAQLPVAKHEQFTQQNYIDQQQLRNSYLGRFGRFIEPVFVPAGFDWRLTTGILAAFPAREVVIPALGIIFSLGGEVDEESGDLRGALHAAKWPDGSPLVTPWTAVSMMVFFALCCQCMATLATIKRESNSWKWPVVAFVYMTTLAYLAAVFITWLGKVVS